jgi:hypothetical protein
VDVWGVCSDLKDGHLDAPGRGESVLTSNTFSLGLLGAHGRGGVHPYFKEGDLHPPGAYGLGESILTSKTTNLVPLDLGSPS